MNIVQRAETAVKTAAQAVSEAVAQTLGHKAITRVPFTDHDVMVDLEQVLSPEQRIAVDQRVIDFYRNPSRYDTLVGVDMGWLERAVLQPVAAATLGQGDIPDRQGFESYPLQVDLYRDDRGRPHFDRDLIIDGRRRTLFHAVFERDGDRVRESFDVPGRSVSLAFKVDPFWRGVRLSVDPLRSTLDGWFADITFYTLPWRSGVRSFGVLNNPLNQPSVISFVMTKKSAKPL